ncbi:hypothetical protein [Fuchsiella alkaliacetigena]|uniref:hypothetical protein n=1 Tax=Fuchsiella alkaliacetigena TaxID=957042 RepID=UPI00200A4EBD|nr:hypothetical protein [Fuchsiella alkaliacetigena]MCK8825875.1 hypothetical protein [Fuchsiella alkaliacetigena]
MDELQDFLLRLLYQKVEEAFDKQTAQEIRQEIDQFLIKKELHKVNWDKSLNRWPVNITVLSDQCPYKDNNDCQHEDNQVSNCQRSHCPCKMN